MITLATMLTPIIYPSLWGDYGAGLNLFETIVLLLRNLILVAVWVFLFWDLSCSLRSKSVPLGPLENLKE